MAEYSKQYCDKYDPGFPHDFDLDELYDQLKPGQSMAVICEGYGFTHISISEEGVKQVVYTNYDESGDDFKFVDLDKIDNKTYKKVFSEA